MDTSQTLRQADAHHRGGRLLEAERLYKIVAAAEPDGFAAWHRLSIIKYQQGHLFEALHLVGEALARDAGSAAAHSNQGLILHALERYEEALASYKRALLIVPGDLDVHVNRANALLALGRCQEALESYDRVLQDQQDDGDVHFNRANALVHLRRFDEARAGYSRALLLKPDLATDLCRRGAGFHRQGRLAEAMTCFEEVLSTNPRDINANHLSGVVKAQQGDLQGSLNRIATAAALAPNVGIIQMNHGNALQALGRITEALDKFDTAIALMPDSFDA